MEFMLGIIGDSNFSPAKGIKISSKYSLPAGNYQVKISLYHQVASPTSPELKLQLGNKTVWFSKQSGSGCDGSTWRKAIVIPGSAQTKTINFNGVTGGKIMLSTIDRDNIKLKVFFKILEVKKI